MNGNFFCHSSTVANIYKNSIEATNSVKTIKQAKQTKKYNSLNALLKQSVLVGNNNFGTNFIG